MRSAIRNETNDDLSEDQDYISGAKGYVVNLDTTALIDEPSGSDSERKKEEADAQEVDMKLVMIIDSDEDGAQPVSSNANLADHGLFFCVVLDVPADRWSP